MATDSEVEDDEEIDGTESDDTSLYFTDGFVSKRDDVRIAAKRNAMSDVDYSQLLYYHKGWGYEEVDDSIHSVHGDTISGRYYWLGKNGTVVVDDDGNLTNEFIKDAAKYGPLNRIRVIDGIAYVVGYGGQVYKRADDKWKHHDKGVLESTIDAYSTDLIDIAGSGATDIYAVGTKGAVFHFDGVKWRRLDFPTNLDILGIKYVSATEVYLCGQQGLIYRGNISGWTDLSSPEAHEDFWGIEHFEGKMYFAHAFGLYVLSNSQLSPVSIGTRENVTCHRLHANDSVLWSIGSDHLFSFNGIRWKEIVCPENEP